MPDDITAPRSGADWVAPACAGLNFFEIDKGLQAGIDTSLPAPLRDCVVPELRRLGAVAGDRLDTLARIADRHPPKLHPRDARGRDAETI